MPKPSTWNRRQPPGAVKDCITCQHWIAGVLVLRGNTLGRCAVFDAPVSADSWCDQHTEAET